VLVVGQHRARREPHQRGHQAGFAIEQQRLGLAAGKTRLLPFHAVGADEMRMRVGGLRALRRHGVHGDPPFCLFWRDPSSFAFGRQPAGVRCGDVVALPVLTLASRIRTSPALVDHY
jgi:hypothetical protein